MHWRCKVSLVTTTVLAKQTENELIGGKNGDEAFD